MNHVAVERHGYFGGVKFHVYIVDFGIAVKKGQPALSVVDQRILTLIFHRSVKSRLAFPGAVGGGCVGCEGGNGQGVGAKPTVRDTPLRRAVLWGYSDCGVG